MADNDIAVPTAGGPAKHGESPCASEVPRGWHHKLVVFVEFRCVAPGHSATSGDAVAVELTAVRGLLQKLLRPGAG